MSAPVDVPTQVKYGKVIGHFVSFLADSVDALAIPDEVPLTGTVTLTPLTPIVWLTTSTPPRIAFPQKVVCPVFAGDLCPPDSTNNSNPGVVVVASEQPELQPAIIQWRASFELIGTKIQPSAIVFNVPDSGVVDLGLIVSDPLTPPTITVVSHADALAAAASADEAERSASAAATSATQSAGSAAQSAGSASNAATSANSASASAAAALASQNSAATSATNSANSATASAGSATASANSATASQTSANNSAGSANASLTSANASAGSATQSQTSATNSATSATASQTSATNSAGSATASANSATASQTSATDSANSAAASQTSATNSEASAVNSAQSAIDAMINSNGAVPTLSALPSQAPVVLSTDNFNRADNSTSLNWLRTNLATNPAYENGTDCIQSGSATVWAPTVETAAPISGTRSLLVTKTATNMSTTVAQFLGSTGAVGVKMPVTAGQILTGGMSVKTDQANASINTRFYWYDAGNVQTQSTPKVQFTGITAGQVYRVADTATVPAGIVACYFAVTIATASGNVVGGEKGWGDLLTIENGTTDGSYFDGSTPDTATIDYAWSGAANASTSTASLLPPWVIPAADSPWGIRGNNAYCVTPTGHDHAYRNTGKADVAVQVKITAIASNAVATGLPGLMVRFVPNTGMAMGGTFWFANGNGLYWVDGTGLVSRGNITPQAVVGDTIRLECRGPALSVLVDYGSTGTFVTKVTYASAGENLTSNLHGMYSRSNLAAVNAWDDFKVETLPVGQLLYVQDTATLVVGDGARWRTVYGDTGLRNVSSMITDPNILQSAPTPIARLRRYGNVVEFYCDFKTIVTTPTSPFPVIQLPVGFRPFEGMYGPTRAYGSYRTSVHNGGNINLYSWPANLQERIMGMWFTTEAWPTTLPGTQYVAPN